MNRILTALFALLALSTILNAQEGANTPRTRQTASARYGPNSLQLLNRSDVQADLQISEGQKVRLQGIGKRMEKDWKSGNRRGQNPATSRLVVQTMLEQADRQAEEILNATQRKRLNEIRIQLRGNMVVLDPEFQKTLDLTDAQKAQIANLQQRQQEQTRQHMRAGDFKSANLAAVMQRDQSSFNASIEKVLTPEQSAKLKQLQGAPFHGQKG